MTDNRTHITVILDRTGSMEAIRDDTIGGYNAFLESQRQEPGTATMTLVQFDSGDPYEVIHQFTPLDSVPQLTRETYVPRASTPLLDAMGRGMNDLEQQLASLEDAGKPSRVLFVIVTDGQENASREFRRDQIAKMIRRKKDEDGWQFVFLSADMNSVDDAVAYGFDRGAVMTYDRTGQGAGDAWDSLHTRIADVRTGRRRAVAFTDEDRDRHTAERQRRRRPGRDRPTR